MNLLPWILLGMACGVLAYLVGDALHVSRPRPSRRRQRVQIQLYRDLDIR